jgi:hypothetical protein
LKVHLWQKRHKPVQHGCLTVIQHDFALVRLSQRYIGVTPGNLPPILAVVPPCAKVRVVVRGIVSYVARGIQKPVGGQKIDPQGRTGSGTTGSHKRVWLVPDKQCYAHFFQTCRSVIKLA